MSGQIHSWCLDKKTRLSEKNCQSFWLFVWTLWKIILCSTLASWVHSHWGEFKGTRSIQTFWLAARELRMNWMSWSIKTCLLKGREYIWKKEVEWRYNCLSFEIVTMFAPIEWHVPLCCIIMADKICRAVKMQLKAMEVADGLKFAILILSNFSVQWCRINHTNFYGINS